LSCLGCVSWSLEPDSSLPEHKAARFQSAVCKSPVPNPKSPTTIKPPNGDFDNPNFKECFQITNTGKTWRRAREKCPVSRTKYAFSTKIPRPTTRFLPPPLA